MEHEEVLTRLRERFPEAVLDHPQAIDFTVVVKPEQIAEIALFLRDEAGFDYLCNLTAVDRPEGFEVVYHLYSIKKPAPPFALKALLPDKQSPHIPSVTGVWQGANYQEREAYDLMGIIFDGHPQLKRILLWEGFPGHPLRKDFVNRTYTYEEMRLTMPAPEER